MADEIGVTRKYHYTVVEDPVIKDTRISKHGLLLYLILAYHTNNAGVCWPSLQTIARETRCARSTVQKALDELMGLGYVKKQRRNIPGKHELDSNIYELTFIAQRRLPLSGTPMPEDGRGSTAQRSPGVPLSGKELSSSELDPEKKSPPAAEPLIGSPRPQEAKEAAKALLGGWLEEHGQAAEKEKTA